MDEMPDLHQDALTALMVAFFDKLQLLLQHPAALHVLDINALFSVVLFPRQEFAVKIETLRCGVSTVSMGNKHDLCYALTTPASF